MQFSEEMGNHVSKAFIQYGLSTFPFPVRIVQTDNDTPFTNGYTAASKNPPGSPSKEPPLHGSV